MNLQAFSIPEFLVDLTHLGFTKGKQRVKMLRFTSKVRSASFVKFMLDSYETKPYKRNAKIRTYYVWKLRQNYVTKITLELR